MFDEVMKSTWEKKIITKCWINKIRIRDTVLKLSQMLGVDFKSNSTS